MMTVICQELVKVYDKGYRDGVKRLARELKKHSCFYDLDNYHSFSAVDVDNMDDIVKEILSEDDD